MFKLGPIAADVVVFGMVGKYLMAMHKTLDDDIVKEDYKLLDVMHHYTSGFKSLFSQTVYENLDICR